MTSPDAAPPERGPRRRSGTDIVVGMLVVIVLVIWTFDLVISAFGPPEPAMELSVRRLCEAPVRVLVCDDPAAGWSALLGGEHGEPLPRGEPVAVQLIEGRGQVWTLAVQVLAAEPPEPVLLDLRAEPEHRVGLTIAPDGAVLLRRGTAALPLARQHLLEPVGPEAWPVLRPRQALPPLPGAGAEPGPAPALWSFGRPRAEG